MKHLFSWVLIISQLAVVPPAFCGETQSPDSVVTPEKTLLMKVIAWKGEEFTSEHWQEQLSAALAQYASNSPSTGRAQRFEQALTDLGIYRPTQAQALMNEASAAGARLTANGGTPGQEAVRSELAQLIGTLPEGAQFSACGTPDTALEIAGAAGSVAGIIGLWAQGSAVPLSNWASISVLSGISLLVVGYTISISCASLS